MRKHPQTSVFSIREGSSDLFADLNYTAFSPVTTRRWWAGLKIVALLQQFFQIFQGNLFIPGTQMTGAMLHDLTTDFLLFIVLPGGDLQPAVQILAQ